MTLRRLVNTSAGNLMVTLSRRWWRWSSYVIFDADGFEVDWAKWTGDDLASMLVNLAGLPEDEATRIAADIRGGSKVEGERLGN